MLIVDFDGPPSWYLDASETGESIKCPWVGVVEGTASGKICTLPSCIRIKRPRWRPVELNDGHLRSHEKIGDCEQSRNCLSSLVLKNPSSQTVPSGNFLRNLPPLRKSIGRIVSTLVLYFRVGNCVVLAFRRGRMEATCGETGLETSRDSFP